MLQIARITYMQMHSTLLLLGLHAAVSPGRFAFSTYCPIRRLMWLGSRVVSVQDSGAGGPGFESQPRRCRVAVLGSGGQTGEWALVQEEQMGPLLTPGKISLNR